MNSLGIAHTIRLLDDFRPGIHFFQIIIQKLLIKEYKKILWLAFLIAIYGSACRTSFPSGKKNKKEKAEWQSILNKSENSVKDYWVELIDGNFNFLNEHQVFLTEPDLPKLKLKPFLVYSLDSASILAFKSKSSLNRILALDKTKAMNFGLKEDTVKVVIYAGYISDTWINWHGYSGIPPLFERKLSILISEKVELYQLNVIAFPTSQKRFMSYMFYVNKKGDFLSLQSNGNEVPLKPLLVSLKKRVLEIQKTL